MHDSFSSLHLQVPRIFTPGRHVIFGVGVHVGAEDARLQLTFVNADKHRLFSTLHLVRAAEASGRRSMSQASLIHILPI